MFEELALNQNGSTYRRLNLPLTFAGMTVFEPASENAPSMPWIDRQGSRMRAISTLTLSFEIAIFPPAADSRSATE